MSDPRHAGLEFMDVPLSESRPVVWAINRYPDPTTQHYDVHIGVEMGVVLAGKSRRLYPQYSFDAVPGSVWFAGLWEPHGMQIVKRGTQHLVLGFLPDFLGVSGTLADCDWMQLFRMRPADRPLADNARQRKFGLDCAARIITILRSDDVYRMARLRIAIQEFLLYFMAMGRSSPGATPAPPVPVRPANLVPALRLIDQHPDRKITLADGAKAAAMSRSLFAEQFRRQTGITFANFSVRRRLAGVMHDLRATDDKMQAIARRRGFADASHLVRVFKAHTGITPLTFRKQSRAGLPDAERIDVDRMPMPTLFL